MQVDGRAFSVVAGLAAAAILVVWITPAEAYEQWSINADATNCRECHGDFRDNNYISPVDGENWGDLHDVHREDMLNDDCDVCHLDGGRFPVLLDDSAGGTGFQSVGCVGCHGIDPGNGEPDWGAGLRLHHTNAGVRPDRNNETCVDCHGTLPVPQPEDVLPVYYFTPDAAHPNKPTDPCNPAPDHPESFAGLVLGTDNDGDLFYDSADPDCGGIMFTDGFESGDTSAWTSQVP
jgi:hypothetical protein